MESRSACDEPWSRGDCQLLKRSRCYLRAGRSSALNTALGKRSPGACQQAVSGVGELRRQVVRQMPPGTSVPTRLLLGTAVARC